MMNLKRRTEGERRAYIQGYVAALDCALLMKLPEQQSDWLSGIKDGVLATLDAQADERAGGEGELRQETDAEWWSDRMCRIARSFLARAGVKRMPEENLAVWFERALNGIKQPEAPPEPPPAPPVEGPAPETTGGTRCLCFREPGKLHDSSACPIHGKGTGADGEDWNAIYQCAQEMYERAWPLLSKEQPWEKLRSGVQGDYANAYRFAESRGAERGRREERERLGLRGPGMMLDQRITQLKEKLAAAEKERDELRRKVEAWEPVVRAACYETGVEAIEAAHQLPREFRPAPDGGKGKQ